MKSCAGALDKIDNHKIEYLYQFFFLQFSLKFRFEVFIRISMVRKAIILSTKCCKYFF